MRRREFIALLGGAAVSWPLRVAAQQAVMPVIGFLHIGAADQLAPAYLAGFRRGLDETGFVEGQNLAIEYRWAEGRIDRLPALAADLTQHRVAVIVTGGGRAPVLAAKAATSTIPIVFNSGDDPVKYGLVPSLNRPGGNLTGVSPMVFMLDPKRLALLHEFVPGASVVAALFNPRGFDPTADLAAVTAAARSLEIQLVTADASGPAEFDAAFEQFGRAHAGALLVTTDPLFTDNRARLVALAAQHGLPAMYPLREFAAAGGLISYGTSFSEVYHQQGVYAGRILKGEKPGDLPVVQPRTFDLVINLKAAKALGLAVPPTLLARADEVIE